MVKASSVGKGIGGFLSSPFGLGTLGIVALGVTLFIFRDKISNFFQSSVNSIGQGLGDVNINLPAVSLPTINLPEFNFPEIKLPEIVLPNLGSIFGEEIPLDLDPSIQESIDNPLNKVNEFVQKFLPQGFNEERTGVSFGTEVIVPRGDELGLGGGLSFIGGTTTFGDNLVDTLSEVLRAFPSLTASQARDALEENQGLTQSQFRLINPDVINLSSEGIDQPQILNNSSGGFSGLTPTQIAQLLTGGNINNF